MKVALVHDYIKEYGGAERVLETLHEMYPDAPVFTLVYAPQFLGPHRDRFRNWDIRASWLRFIPFNYKLISIFRLIAPWVFKSFDFRGFDVVIVSATGAYSPNSIVKKSALQICYCHTPPRYLYGYKTAREQSKNPWVKFGVLLMSHILRMVDFVSSQNVDIFIANSEEVSRRIEKFYRRDAVVVYPPATLRAAMRAGPPVDIKILSNKDIKISSEKREKSPNISISQYPGTYYLAGGRLARPKNIELIVKAFNELKLPLKIFGKGFAGYGEELEKIAGKNIEFLGEVSDEEKFELMRGAKAYVFASVDEDFGILPVEAMSVGTPVIAYKSGGVLETVVDGKTGVFFEELSVESISRTIKHFDNSNHRIRTEDCIKQAQKFSKENFISSIKKIVNNL